MSIDWIGWVATGVFAGSYLCKEQAALRRTQAAAASLWAIYGALIHATPVMVANLLVGGMAIYSSIPTRKRVTLPAGSGT
jgi:hypothetical protein